MDEVTPEVEGERVDSQRLLSKSHLCLFSVDYSLGLSSRLLWPDVEAAGSSGAEGSPKELIGGWRVVHGGWGFKFCDIGGSVAAIFVLIHCRI